MLATRIAPHTPQRATMSHPGTPHLISLPLTANLPLPAATILSMPLMSFTSSPSPSRCYSCTPLLPPTPLSSLSHFLSLSPSLSLPLTDLQVTCHLSDHTLRHIEEQCSKHVRSCCRQVLVRYQKCPIFVHKVFLCFSQIDFVSYLLSRHFLHSLTSPLPLTIPSSFHTL
jgi:hypothetical protein